MADDGPGNSGERQTIEDRALEGDPRAGADLTRARPGTSTAEPRGAAVRVAERDTSRKPTVNVLLK